MTRSIAEYDKILAVAPDDGRALNGRAWGYAQKGELDKALADSERAVSLLGDEPNAIHTRAWIHMNRGNLDLALADFDRALAIDPATAGAYADRGRAYELKGDRDQAIADYRKALSLKSRQLYDDKAKAEAKKHLAALGVAASDSASPNSRADQAANPKEPGRLSASP